MSRSMTRRSALVLLGAGFGGTALGFHRWSGSSASQMGSAELFALIQSEFRPDAKSIELGAAYLEKFPALRNADLLARRIAVPPAVPAAEWLRDKVVRDFEGGSTLFLGGWLVTETEAQLCAVAYLLGKDVLRSTRC